MLRWRITISIVLVSILAGLFWFDHYRGGTAPLLLIFTVLIGARGSWELIELLKTRNPRLSYPLVVIGCSLVIASGWAHVWFPQLPGETPRASTLTTLGVVSLTLSSVVLMLLIAGAIRYRRPGDNMETLSAEMTTVAYIGVLLAVTAQLRWVGGVELGYYALASVLVAAKSGDIGAYILGKNIGGRKMAPLLSPGKTWAGAVGSIVGSILGGSAWMYFALHQFAPDAKPGAWWCLALYSGLIGLAGLVGDLCESLIKRDVGRKDSAPLMPGFGGLLDLLDSVIFAGPVAVGMWMTLPLIDR